MIQKSHVFYAIGLFVSTNINAALITENFTSTVLTGEFAGTEATGSFTYDDSLITVDGPNTSSIFANDGLTVELTIFGQTFTEQDDVEYGGSTGWPGLFFYDDVAVGLALVVSEVQLLNYQPFLNLTNIDQDGVTNFGYFEFSPASTGGYEGSFAVNDIAVVPVPATIWLFGSGIVGIAGFAARKNIRN